MIWKLPARDVQFPRRPLVMGIVNVNDDSFSGDGTLEIDEAVELARQQAAQGADVIDVGAESARTNREAIQIGEEVERFRGFLDRWTEVTDGLSPRDETQVWPPVLSANTWRPEVVREVLPMGVELLNDMGGLPDPSNAESCAAVGASLLIMHSVGEPKVPHLDQQWEDVMAAMTTFFEDKIRMAEGVGLGRESIVIDPGIDFAKQREDNLQVIRKMEQLKAFGCPLLLPISRKTVIGEVLNLPEPRDRDPGTVGLMAAVTRRGANLVRVHHVEAAWQAAKMLDPLVRV